MLLAENTLMFAEAAEAADVIAQQLIANTSAVEKLVQRLQAHPPRWVLTCARGSSNNAATYAKFLFETHLGIPTSSTALAVASVYATQPKLDDVLFIAISQSGKSPDLLRNVASAKAAGAYVVALVNTADSPLATLADTVLPLHAGPERSVAATKSYLCTLSALLQLVAHWSADDRLHAALAELPQQMRTAWQQDWSPLVASLHDAHHLYVLGRGLGLSVAQEAALKFKETCSLHAEAFSSAEVKHGPMALVTPGFPVLAFAQDDATGDSTRAVADEFLARGANVWLATTNASGDHQLPLPASAHPAVTPLLTAQAFYAAVNALSVARGFNPDVPPYLKKVTETL